MFIDHQQEQWPEWLEMTEFAYNNKVHTRTKVSPFQVNYEQNPRMELSLGRRGSIKEQKDLQSVRILVSVV